VGLGIASLVYGGLLGAFTLSLFVSDIRPGAVMASVATGIATVTAIWLFAREAVAWPWFTLIGTAVTFGTGALAAAFRRSLTRSV
jgi:SSS family solute:Na+ symporter